HHVEHDLQDPGPPAPSGGLVDREWPPEQEVAPFGHADLNELAGLGLVGDLGCHQGQRPVRSRTPVRQDLAARSDHAISPIIWPWTCGDAAAGARVTAAWYSCSDLTPQPPARAASMPWTAASTPGMVVMHGMPALAAAVRMK